MKKKGLSINMAVELPSLPKFVRIKGTKHKTKDGWGVIVRGADGKTVTRNADYYYARSIGESYNVGDTLNRPQ